MRKLIFLSAIIASIIPIAGLQAATPIWKYYGMIENGEDGQFLFFDAAGVKYLPDRHIKVWTKGVLSSVINSKLDHDRDEDIIKSSGSKFANAEYPPYASIVKLTSDQILSIILAETRLALRITPAASNIMYEIDCENDLIRTLSIHMDINGRREDADIKGKWVSFPPDSNGAWLEALTCKS